MLLRKKCANPSLCSGTQVQVKQMLEGLQGIIMKKNISEVYNPEIKLNIKIDGILLESALEGQQVNMATKGAITTYDPDHRTFMNNLISIFVNINDLETINRLLVQIKSNNTAYIYRDFPFGYKIFLSSQKELGSVIFQNEITDIESIFFEDDLSKIEYEPSDKIVYLFRSNWSFGLYFNFQKKDSFDIISKEIAYLYKVVAYRQIFEFLQNDNVSIPFQEDGWFPFNALVRYENIYRLITYYSQKKANITDLELIKSAFSKERMEMLTERWWKNPIFESKKEILKCGIESYLRHDKQGYINCIKVLVSEIEGILRFAFKDTISGRRIKPFLDELEEQGTSKYFTSYSLVFPYEFIDYLRNSIFANFDFSDDKIPQSRHAYSHGVADIDKYNWERSLQIILTIDQILIFL